MMHESTVHQESVQPAQHIMSARRAGPRARARPLSSLPLDASIGHASHCSTRSEWKTANVSCHGSSALLKCQSCLALYCMPNCYASNWQPHRDALLALAGHGSLLWLNCRKPETALWHPCHACGICAMPLPRRASTYWLARK